MTRWKQEEKDWYDGLNDLEPTRHSYCLADPQVHEGHRKAWFGYPNTC